MTTDVKRDSVYTPAVLVLAAIVGISFLGLGFVMPLRALYGRELGASSGEIGLMASVALLTGFVAAPGLGWLTDRVGARPMLAAGVLAHAVLVLAYIPVGNPALLIVLRGLEGIAIVAVLPPARALMNAMAPKTRQGEALGLLGSAQMVGILMGPAIGTELASLTSYTDAFLVASVPLFIATVAAWVFLPRGAHGDTGARASVPVTNGALFTRPMLLVYGLTAVLGLTSGVIQAIWSIYMLDRGASLLVIGLSYATYALPAGLMGPLAGRISDQRGRFWPIIGGLLLYAAIYIVFGLPISPFWIVVLSAVEGFAAAVARSALDGLLADVMPTEGRGKAQANYSAAQTAGSFAGATAAGFLYAISPGAPFTINGVIFLVTAGVLFLPALGRLFPAPGALRFGGEGQG
ncbi:MAG TPA: MFS transporter [Ktedonobacterales bacterium]